MPTLFSLLSSGANPKADTAGLGIRIWTSFRFEQASWAKRTPRWLAERVVFFVLCKAGGLRALFRRRGWQLAAAKIVALAVKFGRFHAAILDSGA